MSECRKGFEAKIGETGSSSLSSMRKEEAEERSGIICRGLWAVYASENGRQIQKQLIKKLL